MGWTSFIPEYALAKSANKGMHGLTDVQAPADRQFQSEINNILGMSDELYGNASQWSPKYADLAASNATRTASNLAGGYRGLADTMGQTNSDLLSKFGGQYVTNLRGLNSNQAALMDELNRQARSGLAAGDRLTPDQQYYATNAIRSDYANRGFTANLPQGLEEAVALARMGDNVRGQRQDFASNVAGMENNFYTSPAATLAIGSGGANAASILGAGGSMSASQPNVLEELAPYASDVYGTNYNGQAAAKIATSNNRTGLVSSMMSY